MTCIKKRKNYEGSDLVNHTIDVLPSVSNSLSGSFLFQFVEKIFECDAETYSYIISVGNIIQTTVIQTITPIFIKVIIIFPLI